MIYEELFINLGKNKIQYLVVGGVAVVLHGFIRATMDLDIMVALDPANLSRFLSMMTRLGYKPKIPVKAIEFSDSQKREKWKSEKGMKVFSFHHPQRPMDVVDVFIYEPIPFKTAYKHRKKLNLGTVHINVIGVRDLISLKQLAGRPQDLEDIRALKQLLKKRMP